MPNRAALDVWAADVLGLPEMNDPSPGVDTFALPPEPPKPVVTQQTVTPDPAVTATAPAAAPPAPAKKGRRA